MATAPLRLLFRAIGAPALRLLSGRAPLGLAAGVACVDQLNLPDGDVSRR